MSPELTRQPDDAQPLIGLPAALIRAGFHDAPSYRRTLEAARSGRLPATLIGARWFWMPDDLDTCAAALGCAGAGAALPVHAA